jgi:hypothetical protein
VDRTGGYASLESSRREELLARIVAGAQGDERVRQFFENATIGELETILAGAEANRGLTHLQAVWEDDWMG